jgi:AcrR family transcriptional regulator
MEGVHNLPPMNPDFGRPDSTADRSDAAPARATYRHGDLRRALLEAGIEQARAGGPDAIVLREATRRAGVVPNAAYRHFASRGELLRAVRSAALSALAAAIEAELGRARRRRDPAAAARARLRAIGTAYVGFAQREPGLFRTAFSGADRRPGEPDPAMAGASGLNPFQLLGAVLDEMVAAAALPRSRRPGAEYLAWSAVHGLSMLLIDGPLRSMPDRERGRVVDALLDMVERGLA